MLLADQVKTLRQFYASGATRSLKFRKEQLRKLFGALSRYEEDIFKALHNDLRKSREETWVTEIALLQSEIRYCIRQLSHWMSPEPVATNLLNWPSSSEIRPEPLGLVLIVGPWNYPLQLLLLPLASAMAAGNCVILKAPEHAHASTAVMKRIIEEIFPPNYVLFLEGEGHKILPGLIRDHKPDHVFFTGSTQVGKLIYQYAAENLVPVTLELGGKSPAVITENANITVSAKRISLAKFSNAGQMCVAPDYLLVHRSVRDSMISALQLCIKSFFGEDPKTSPDFGRIINRRQFDRLSAYLKDTRVLFGGETDADDLYIAPTLVEADPGAAIMQEEIFGPILPIIVYDSEAEAQDIIARNPNPLAFYVFTNRRNEADAWLNAVPAGGACVNNVSWHLTNHHLPFGGRGASGIGAYHGKAGFDRFSHLKSVMRTPTWFDPFIKYPPFAGKLKWLKRIV